MIGLIITTYNRPKLLKACLDSICSLAEMPDMLFIVDDCSTDRKTIEHIQNIQLPIPVSRIYNSKNRGIKKSLQVGFNAAFQCCDLAMNLDADAQVKPYFISIMKKLRRDHPDRIISGFNCNHPINPVLSESNGYVERRHCNGINMLVDRHQYSHILLPALSSVGNWDFNSTHEKPFIISRPSLVQHLGFNESTMGHINGDVAIDF